MAVPHLERPIRRDVEVDAARMALTPDAVRADIRESVHGKATPP